MSKPTTLPDGVQLTRTTPTFDEQTVPPALLSAHRIADGVWGRLVVVSGEIDFTFEDDPDGVRRLAQGDVQVIAPGVLHHIAPCGAARFHIEFHR